LPLIAALHSRPSGLPQPRSGVAARLLPQLGEEMNFFAQVKGVALAQADQSAKFKLVTSVSAAFLRDRNLAN
jgi:hypothetical protein